MTMDLRVFVSLLSIRDPILRAVLFEYTRGMSQECVPHFISLTSARFFEMHSSRHDNLSVLFYNDE